MTCSALELLAAERVLLEALRAKLCDGRGFLERGHLASAIASAALSVEAEGVRPVLAEEAGSLVDAFVRDGATKVLVSADDFVRWLFRGGDDAVRAPSEEARTAAAEDPARGPVPGDPSPPRPPASRRVLCTGADGPAGWRIAGELAGGGFDVSVVARCAESFERAKELAQQDIAVFKVDLFDEASVDELFHQQQFDAVVRLSDLSAYASLLVDPVGHYEHQVSEIVVLLGAMARHCCNTIVYSSLVGDSATPARGVLSAVRRPDEAVFMAERILQDAAASNKRLALSLLRCSSSEAEQGCHVAALRALLQDGRRRATISSIPQIIGEADSGRSSPTPGHRPREPTATQAARDMVWT